MFKIYYDTVDEMRMLALGQEYKLRAQMDEFEDTIAVLMRDIKKFNYIEFFHEQEQIKGTVRNIRDNLKNFNLYMPKYALAVEDM